ncbi:XRE family transcriptional regulator [Luedemannella flava]
MEWVADSGTKTIPRLSAALMDYRLITPVSSPSPIAEMPSLVSLAQEVDELWQAYQASRFGYVTTLLPETLSRCQTAVEAYDSDDQVQARRLLAFTYQLAATQMTKIGEVELAWIAADRGLAAARITGDPVAIGSLLRSVAHALLAAGRFREAMQLIQDTASYLDPHLSDPSPELLAVHGTLFLTGSMAAARANDTDTTRTFLKAADESAQRIGQDANHVWTAFGPTNVAIHRVATAGELGNVQVAMDLGPRIDTSALPMERRVRHALEVARAYSSWNRTDDALSTLLAAERIGPEQVRYHFLSRQLVLTWIKRQKGRPSSTLADLAHRLKVLD